MPPDLTDLGVEVHDVVAIGGGDTCRAWRATLPGGRAVFIKQSPAEAVGMTILEAAGLSWLAAGGARTPPVVAGCGARSLRRARHLA